jgi:hypothetical protein
MPDEARPMPSLACWRGLPGSSVMPTIALEVPATGGTRAIISPMDLPALLAAHQRELAAPTPEENTERREALQWMIRRAEIRMADLRERLIRPADPAAAAAEDDA